VITGLEASLPYTLTVVGHLAGNALTDVGTGPNAVVPFPPTSEPPAPVTINPVTDVVVTAGDSQLVVTWTVPEEGLDDIGHYTATATDGDTSRACSTADNSQNTCTIGGLTAGTQYSVSVVSIGVKGDMSDPADATGTTTPVGTPASGPVVRNADGRLVIAARGNNNALLVNFETAPNAGTWAGWTSLGGSFTTEPVIIRSSDGRLTIFAVATDGNVYAKSQTTPGSTSWRVYVNVGGGKVLVAASLTYALNADGRIQIFARGNNKAIWTAAQTTVGGQAWSAWTDLKGFFVGSPTASLNPNGKLQVFALSTDKTIYQNTQQAAGATAWTGWVKLTNASSASVSGFQPTPESTPARSSAVDVR